MGNRCEECEGREVLRTETHWGLWLGLGLGYSSDTILLPNLRYLEIKSFLVLFVKIGVATEYECVREEVDSIEGTDNKEDEK